MCAQRDDRRINFHVGINSDTLARASCLPFTFDSSSREQLRDFLGVIQSDPAKDRSISSSRFREINPHDGFFAILLYYNTTFTFCYVTI